MSVYRLERDGEVAELVRLLRESDAPAVRRRAAASLGAFEESAEPVVESLIETVREDPNADVRAAGVDALDELGTDAVERLLVELADVDPEEYAEWATERAYVEALSAELPPLRMAAANALGRTGDDEAVPALLERLEDPDPRVRARVARALGRIGDPRSASPLVAATDDEDPAVREAVARALGDIGGDESRSAVVALLDDRADAVRRAAAAALGSFDDAGPVEPLVDALDDDAEVVRRTAVYSLIELLANAPTEQSHDRRDEVVAALSATEDRTVLGPLVEILEEGSHTGARRNAAWLLGRAVGGSSPDRAIGALVDALDDDDEMVSQFASTSLATIGGSAVESALISALDQVRSPDTRADIVFTLGKVGGERARERLDALVDEAENDQVRQRTFAALSRLGGR